MAVEYTPPNSTKIVRDLLIKHYERVKQAVFTRLQRIGEQFVEDARSVNTYTDQTGNLRSSIGYIILYNGQQVDSSGFEQVKQGGEGAAEGRKIALEAAKKFPEGYVLITVAGMDYAAAVESKGKDVLTGSSQVAEERLKKTIATLTQKATTLK